MCYCQSNLLFQGKEYLVFNLKKTENGQQLFTPACDVQFTPFNERNETEIYVNENETRLVDENKLFQLCPNVIQQYRGLPKG